MATAAFKSTTGRTPIGKSASSSSSAAAATSDDSYSSSSRTASAHRRSRSLSRFSRPAPPPRPSDDEQPIPSGRFVNKTRGSGVPDITLDDLAIMFFSSGDRGRSVSRYNNDDVSAGNGKSSASHRRGRSVARRVSEGKGNFGNSYVGREKVKLENNSNSRRRRSVSAVRCHMSDSESDLDQSQNSSTKVALLNSTTALHNKQGLRRTLSQKDLKYHHDGYSSHSSVLTDDEGRDSHPSAKAIEKTIRAVYSQKKANIPTGDDVNGGLYEAMRKELRNAVEEIKMGLEHSSRKPSNDCLQSKNSDLLKAVSTIRRNHEIELSQKSKQDLLAQILLEEQRGRGLSKKVKELLLEPKNNVTEKPSRARKKSNDRSRMSKRLTEEAEKYFEDFISNVEDTDISSLDGEMTDTSSSLGGTTKGQIFQSPALSKSAPIEMEGVVLPWLQWETSNDASPLSSKKTESTVTPKTPLWEAAQEATHVRDLSNCSLSSRGSWSPGVTDDQSTTVGEVPGNRIRENGSCFQLFSTAATPRIDIDEYLKHKSDEDFLLETWKQRHRIHAGSLLLCNQMFF